LKYIFLSSSAFAISFDGVFGVFFHDFAFTKQRYEKRSYFGNKD